jgi:hypothetical protein
VAVALAEGRALPQVAAGPPAVRTLEAAAQVPLLANPGAERFPAGRDPPIQGVPRDVSIQSVPQGPMRIVPLALATRRFHRGRGGVGIYEGYGYEGYGYSGDCGYYRCRAIITGSRNWWRRYRECRGW